MISLILIINLIPSLDFCIIFVIILNKMEVYKEIKGFDGYAVSNQGNVKSLERDVIRKSKFGKEYIYHLQEKILVKRKDKDGYEIVNLFDNGKSVTLKVHRLVAESFIDNPNNFPIINHKDCNVSNNSVDNLEWCNYSYNNSYLDAGYKRALKKGKPLIAYKDGKEVGRFVSSYEAAKALNCSSGNIRSNLRGADHVNTVKGYTFKYEE